MAPKLTVPKSELRTLALAYERGLSIRALASARGWSYGKVHTRLVLCQEEGMIEIRPRGFRAQVNKR